jgi:hypothetical protein
MVSLLLLPSLLLGASRLVHLLLLASLPLLATLSLASLMFLVNLSRRHPVLAAAAANPAVAGISAFDGFPIYPSLVSLKQGLIGDKLLLI